MPIGRVFPFDDIQEAHRVMEAGTAGGKIVVVVSEQEQEQVRRDRDQ